MPPTFILILAGIIVISLVLLAVDLGTRRRRRRRIDTDRAAEYAFEEEPIPGLSQVALVQGWKGPVADPVLAPRIQFGGNSAQVHPLVGLIPAEQLQAKAQPVSVSSYAANLTARLHSALSPDKRIKGRFRYMDGEMVTSRPDYLPVPRPRLVHCYCADVGDAALVVGNCYLTLDVRDMGTGYGGPIPDIGYIGSAFCAVTLSRAITGRLQIVPDEKSRFGRGAKSGFAELDDRYNTLAQFPKGSRSRLLKRIQHLLPDQPDWLGPSLAAFIAGRDGWAFTLDRGLLICATLEPLHSGEDALGLVADTMRAAHLVGT